MNLGSRRRIARAALAMSLEVRARPELDVDTRTAIDIFDACDALGVSVRAVGINMEGMYVRDPPQILVSALRPYSRRVFTCAHELGHHLFGHGSTIDRLIEEASGPRRPDPREVLVQLFAGHLLMPVLGMRRAFAQRGWDVRYVGPAELLTIACSFGVSYEAVVTHLASTLELLPEWRAGELRRVPLPRVREMLTGTASNNPLVVVDRHWLLPTVDTEVGTDILLPQGSRIAADTRVLEPASAVRQCPVFHTAIPGVCTVEYPAEGQLDRRLVRVARHQYVGLSRYRFLENQDDWDVEDEGA